MRILLKPKTETVEAVKFEGEEDAPEVLRFLVDKGLLKWETGIHKGTTLTAKWDGSKIVVTADDDSHYEIEPLGWVVGNRVRAFGVDENYLRENYERVGEGF